jgi:glycosyltransferase involved in cell wall biosynthesis
MAHAQNVGLALIEAESLIAYVTTFAYRRDGRIARLLERSPWRIAQKFNRELARRSLPLVPSRFVQSYPAWEMLRSAAQKAGASPTFVDRLWDIESHRFDEWVARRYVSGAQAVQGFEYSSLATFQRARQEGIARILHLPSLDSGQYSEIQRRERSLWKELESPHDAYFERKFARRQERRSAEIALADVVVCNSSLTARSHIAAGVDPTRVFVVRLGAPPPIAAVRTSVDQRTGPLRVISAGPFSLRKGAHYLLEGWRRLNAGKNATLDVYGRLELPEQVISGNMEGITFHGSTPQAQLFAAFEQADVLVFPTLSDGFGMVVAEALAHGLPVITTDQAGAVDLVTQDNGLIVPAANPQAIAEALRWCLDNRERLESMRGSALASARKRQWSDFRRDLIAILNTGLRRRGYSPSFRPSAAIGAILAGQ